jgi:hypothetical protein
MRIASQWVHREVSKAQWRAPQRNQGLMTLAEKCQKGIKKAAF